jgi:hypothetical protein
MARKARCRQAVHEFIETALALSTLSANLFSNSIVLGPIVSHPDLIEWTTPIISSSVIYGLWKGISIVQASCRASAGHKVFLKLNFQKSFLFQEFFTIFCLDTDRCPANLCLESAPDAGPRGRATASAMLRLAGYTTDMVLQKSSENDMLWDIQ